MTEDRRDRVREVFDSWAEARKDEGLESGHLPVVLDTFKSWTWGPSDRFLDVGCGNGYAVRLAAELAPEGEAFGLDLSPEMIRRARALSEGMDRVRYLQGDLLQSDLERAGFDKVFSMETLYYLEDVGAAFSRIHELLAAGGECAVCVDYYQENPDTHDWPTKLDIPMTLLSEKDYASLARKAGLEDVSTDRVRQPGKGGWKEREGTLRIRGHRS